MEPTPELEHRIVPIDEIAPHPANPRTALGDLDELAPSISALGLLIAPVVVPAEPVAALWPDHAAALAGKAWVVLSGHRRLAALAQAADGEGDAMVTVAVRRDGLARDRVAQLAFMRTDNIARTPLTPMEEARCFQQAQAEGHSQRQIARQTGCTQPHVSRRLALLRLPAELHPRIDSGELSLKDGIRLAELDGHETMLGVWRLLADTGPDRWITTLERAIDEYTARQAYRQRRAVSIARASDEHLEVIDPVGVFGGDAAGHRLADAAEIDAARAQGVLSTAVNGDGDLEYYTSVHPAQTRTEARDHRAEESERHQMAAARARERAVLALASRPPRLDEAAADIVTAWIDTASTPARRLARRWLAALHIGPGADMPTPVWWHQIRQSEWKVKLHAAHALALARCEVGVRGHEVWDDEDIAWLRRLIDQAGYVPTGWERDRLRAAERTSLSVDRDASGGDA